MNEYLDEVELKVDDLIDQVRETLSLGMKPTTECIAQQEPMDSFMVA